MKIKKIVLFVISLALSASCVMSTACAGYFDDDKDGTHVENPDGGDQGGTDQGGSDQGGSDQGGTDQGGSDQGGSDQGGTDQGGTDQGGTDQGGTDQGGTDQGGTDQGGTDQGGTDQGGTDQGGTDQGGTDQGGTDQGGSDQGGTDQGGTDQGGTDQGGTDQGGTDQGGTDQGGTDQGGEEVTQEVTVTFMNGSAILSSVTIDENTCTQPYDLVVDGYYVSGWYEKADFSGEPYDFTQPFTKDTTLYAKLVAVEKTVTYASSASESAAFEWTDSTAAAAKVQYKLSNSSSYTSADTELIRQISSTTARVDIVGLKGGANYDFRITTSDNEVIDFEDVTISSYDHSGYAHFKKSGIGAYNDDGTLKSNAQVIYVSEANKNTVKATLNGKSYTGLVSILQNVYRSSNPVAIRIIGKISAATWNKIDYNADGKYSSDNKLPASKVIGANGKALPTSSTLTEEDIISGGYNTLNTAVATKLNGLTNKVKYSGGEFDSYYNMCDIDLAQNVTIEGIGEDAEFFQWGLTWKKCNSIEVRNITFDDYTEDACSFEGSKDATTIDGFDSKYIWVHNNTFNEGINYWDVCAEQDKHEGDGGTDFKRNAYITVSYNHYYNNHKTGLVGGSDSNTTACVTFHHNFYEKCSSRLPLGRQANMHMYNNYYYGSTGTNMSLRAGAYALIENCYFDNAKNPVTTQDGDDKRGVVKIYNCTFKGISLDTKYDVTVVSDRTQTVDNDNIFSTTFDTDSSVFYYDSANKCSDVEIMNATADLPELIPQVAGTLHRNNNLTGGSSSGNQGGTTGGNEGEEGGSQGGQTGGNEGGDQSGEVTQSELFKAESLTANVADGETFYNGTNFSVQLSSNKATLTEAVYSDGVNGATANDGSQLTFTHMLLPNGSTISYVITAKESCTITVYYTCTDKNWATSSDYGKSGILTVNGTQITEDADTQGNKLSGTAYAYTFTVVAGQTYTLTSSSNRLVLFGISAK